MRNLLLVFLVLLCGPAAARCAPFESSAGYLGVVTGHSVTDPDGPWLTWKCYAMQGDAVVSISKHCISAPWSAIDLRRLGDRADTIRSAADPLAAWHASIKRHVAPGVQPRCVALLKGLQP